MLAITKYLASPRNYSKVTGKKNRCIVVHYVGGVSSAKANAQNLRNNQAAASAQYFVDQTSIYQTVEDFDAAWGCSASSYRHPYARNTTSIHIEMCCKRSPAGTWYLEPKTVQNTVELTVSLMKKHGIPIADVIRHYDVTGKHCPEPFVRVSTAWEAFRTQVFAALSGSTASDIKYTVRLSATDKASQIGAFAALESAKQMANKNPGYEVYNLDGKMVYNPTGNTQLFSYYKVKPDDSFWGIAASQMGNGQRMYELAKFNGMTVKTVLKPNQVIKVPA